MIDTLKDIETLQNVLIALDEGASDEKRAALRSLRNMLKSKVREVENFENELETMFDIYEREIQFSSA